MKSSSLYDKRRGRSSFFYRGIDSNPIQITIAIFILKIENFSIIIFKVKEHCIIIEKFDIPANLLKYINNF